MDKIKKIILFSIPMSICNFRCHYCYLAQRDESYQGVQPIMKYTPQEVAAAFSKKRIGGVAYMNFCADGETLLTKNIDLYIKALVEQGHYAEIVTNLVVTSVLEKILSWDKELLKRVEFKCSFHYLELKKRNLLNVFAENVKKVWSSGASANIEITPSDELIPYIDDVKKFSIDNFGALPHLTIARDDRTSSIDYLTDLSIDNYNKNWSQFKSGFWEYKKSIFGVKQKSFCYAGMWSLYVDLTTGSASQCYCGKKYKDIIKNPCEPLPCKPIGSCPIAHCYNGHALLTIGLIPGITDVGYGDIRNRIKNNGEEWLQPELKAFFNSKLKESNCELNSSKKTIAYISNTCNRVIRLPARVKNKIKRKIIKKNV